MTKYEKIRKKIIIAHLKEIIKTAEYSIEWLEKLCPDEPAEK